MIQTCSWWKRFKQRKRHLCVIKRICKTMYLCQGSLDLVGFKPTRFFGVCAKEVLNILLSGRIESITALCKYVVLCFSRPGDFKQMEDTSCGSWSLAPGHMWTINRKMLRRILMWPLSMGREILRPPRLGCLFVFVKVTLRRSLAAHCRCTAAQQELRHPDECTFIWVQYIWYLIQNSVKCLFVSQARVS